MEEKDNERHLGKKKKLRGNVDAEEQIENGKVEAAWRSAAAGGERGRKKRGRKNTLRGRER